MKCPVCKSELKDRVCPNCGYEDNKNAKEKCPKTNYKAILVAFVTLAIAITCFILRAKIAENRAIIYTRNYQNLTFSVVLEKDYDEDDTVQNIQDFKLDIIKYLEDNHYTVTNKIEQCSKYSKNDLLEAYLNLSFEKDNIQYTISTTYEQGKMISSYFDITFYKDSKEYTIPDNISIFLKKLNIDENVFNDHYSLMTQTNEKTYTYLSEDENIEMTETFNDKQYICYYMARKK